MKNLIDQEIKACGPLSELALSLGLNTWLKLFRHLKHLPYGRNACRSDFSLVLKEGQGSCSSKHALAKQIAVENRVEELKLILVFYKMNPANTPGIGSALDDFSLDYIPEAHCYINFNSIDWDLTNSQSSVARLQPYIISKEEIEARQVIEDKIFKHKQFLKEWLKDQCLSYDLVKLWTVRERCIENLSKTADDV